VTGQPVNPAWQLPETRVFLFRNGHVRLPATQLTSLKYNEKINTFFPFNDCHDSLSLSLSLACPLHPTLTLLLPPWTRCTMDPTGARHRAPSPSSSSSSIPPLPSKPNPSYHRRSHSETFLRIPDDLFFDVSDPDFSISDLDFPSLSDETSDPPPPPPPAEKPAGRSQSGTHIRSLSMDAAFFDGLGFQVLAC
jgi:hypothetical protein